MGSQRVRHDWETELNWTEQNAIWGFPGGSDGRVCNAIWSSEWKIWPLLVWTKGNPPTLFRLKLVQPLWKTVWWFLRKLKIELPYDPAILLLGIYPDKTVTQRDTFTALSVETSSAIAKTQKQPQCPPTDEWVKMWHTHATDATRPQKGTKSGHLQRCAWT